MLKIEKKLTALIKFAKKNQIAFVGGVHNPTTNQNGCFSTAITADGYLSLMVSFLEQYLKYHEFDVNSINKLKDNLDSYFNSIKLLREIAS